MKTTSESKIVKLYGATFEVTPRVGSRVSNGHRANSRWENLLPCTEEPCFGWAGADFRFPCSIHGWEESHAASVNVEVTGRKVHTELWTPNWVTIRLTFVNDCEPDTHVSGRMLLDDENCREIFPSS